MSDAPRGNYSDTFGMAFQRHALACVIRHPDIALKYRSALAPAFFDSTQLQVICDCYLKHIDEHRVGISRGLLIEMVKEHKDVQVDARDSFVEVVNKLYKETTVDQAAVASRLVMFGKGQALTKAVLESATYIEMHEHDKVLPTITDALKVGQNIGENRLNYMGATDAERLAWYDENDDVIPSGMEHIDTSMNGGIRRGEVVTMVAAAKKGKSTFLSNVGYGMITQPMGYNVLHFTLELKRRYVARRYDMRIAGPSAPHRKDKPNRFTRMVKENRLGHVQGQLIISEHVPQTLSANGIRRELDELISEGVNVDAIIVDYADIMKPDDRTGLGKDVRHKYSQIYTELVGVTKERNIGTWTATQSNRASYKSEVVDLGDVSEDIGKVQIVDGIWTMNQSPDEKHAGTFRAYLAGYRNGMDGIIVNCDIDRSRNYIATTSMEPYTPRQHRERDDNDGRRPRGRMDRRVAALNQQTGTE